MTFGTIRSRVVAASRSNIGRLWAGIAVVSTLAAACTGADVTTSTADDSARESAVDGSGTTEPELAAVGVPDVTVAFEPAPEDGRWNLVGIGDSFIGWSTVTERYAEVLGEQFGIEIAVEKIVHPTSNRLEYIRTDDRSAAVLAAAEIVVVEPQPGPPSAAAWDRYLAGVCGGTDNQECLRTARADFALYVGDLFDELIALTPDDATIIAVLVGTWGVEAFNPGLEDDDPHGYRIFVEHIVTLQDISAEAGALRGIASVDVSAAFNGPHYDRPVPEGYLQPDRAHLTEEGSLVVARLIHELSHPVDDEVDGATDDNSPPGDQSLWIGTPAG